MLHAHQLHLYRSDSLISRIILLAPMLIDSMKEHSQFAEFLMRPENNSIYLSARHISRELQNILAERNLFNAYCQALWHMEKTKYYSIEAFIKNKSSKPIKQWFSNHIKDLEIINEKYLRFLAEHGVRPKTVAVV